MAVPERMKAGLYWGHDDVRVEEMPVPHISPREILAAVKACGICGSDTMRWYRDPAVEKKGGINTGHEIAAQIAQVGEAITQYKAGDRVVVTHHFPCMECTQCQEGNETACEAMHEKHIEPGGFAEYIRILEPGVSRGLYPLPESMTYDQGSFVEPLGCVVRSLRKTSPLEGHTVLVFGSGLAGLLHIKLARALGAKKISAVDTNESRLKAALLAGADEALYATDKLPRANRIYVCTGSPAAAETALESVDRGGNLLFFAADGPDKKLSFNLTKFWLLQPGISFSYGAAPRDMREALELIGSGKVRVDDLITHRFGIDQFPEAFRLAANPRDGSLKVIVEPQARCLSHR
ncbi:MAG: alcohol dehydrogenase catalytic domain-containing protein [Acidobacteria bacterium]|nr:alcohol dehydrogenase catalytic domain-containing protein [Acidobacteriota bacterium]